MLGEALHVGGVNKPLALVYYASLLPGSQLAGRLQDMGYRVQAIPEIAGLADLCARRKPIVAVIEISPGNDAREEVAAIRDNPLTHHIQVLAFTATTDAAFLSAAQDSGIALVAASSAVLEHLPQLLDRVLQVD